jgi:hypothetical protein
MHIQQNQPKDEKKTSQEPVYVDDIFPPDEEVQDEAWEISARDELVDDNSPDAILEVNLEDEDIQGEEDNFPYQPSKSGSNQKKYRLKIPVPPSRRLHNIPPYSTHKPLPKKLPPLLKQQPQRSTQAETWPVAPGASRNGSTQFGSFTPPLPNPNVSSQSGNKKPSPDSSRINKSRENLSKEQVPVNKSAPPPVLPYAPVKAPSTPKPIFPVERENFNDPPHEQKSLDGTSFQPLIDDVSAVSEEEDTTTRESGWDRIDALQQEPHLHDLIEQLQIPVNSLILGICTDGLPLVLELSDPSPGALLFLGDDVEELRDHLQAVVASICLLSDPKQVQVDVISPQPETFATQKLLPHVRKIHLPDQGEMFDLLGCLFELVEQRQRKDNSLVGKLFGGIKPSIKGPVRILIIDQIDRLVEQLATESLAYLRWLLRRGPAASVWVLASLNAQNAQDLDGKTLKSFGLQIAGKIRKSGKTTQLTEIPLEKLASLKEGEACLKLDEEVIGFSVLNI